MTGRGLPVITDRSVRHGPRNWRLPSEPEHGHTAGRTQARPSRLESSSLMIGTGIVRFVAFFGNSMVATLSESRSSGRLALAPPWPRPSRTGSPRRGSPRPTPAR